MNYFDLHCDTISECCKTNQALASNQLQLSIEKGNGIEKWIQTYAIWIDDGLDYIEAYEEFNRVYTYFIKEINENEDKICFCTCSDEIERTLSLGKRAALLSIEGSRALGKDIEKLQEFYNKGVRMMTLTWNDRSPVGDGCMVENAGGLTDFGKQVVKRMEQIGMVIDVSHLSEKGFWEVVEETKKPFVATHSNSKAICQHPRNLTDEQFKLIVERKGLVGMNYYPLFINGTMEGKINELLKHIDHFIDLGGQDIIAMGSDFDGAKMPKDIEGIQDIDYLYNQLINRYGKTLCEKFYFENAYRFWKY